MKKLNRFNQSSFSFIIYSVTPANNSKEGLLPRGYETLKKCRYPTSIPAMAMTESNQLKL